MGLDCAMACDQFVSCWAPQPLTEVSSGIFRGTIGSSEASYAYCRLMLLLPISRGMRMEFKSHFSSLLSSLPTDFLVYAKLVKKTTTE